MKRKRDCGIYRITNTANGKIYIGSAVNLPQRWSDHRWNLERGLHPNRHLQSAWNKYGGEAFVCDVQVRVSEALLIETEQEYLDRFTPYDPSIGYNISKIAGSTLGISCTPEKAAKIGNANRGRIRSEAHKAILRKYAGSAAFTAETGRKISEANKRRGAMTPELILMGIEARRGKSLSAEHKAKKSAAMKANLAHHEHLRALNDKTRGKSTILTPEQIAALISDREAGMSYVALGKKYGVSNVTAKNWCMRFALTVQSTADQGQTTLL
jgi:group I intron endonuclease